MKTQKCQKCRKTYFRQCLMECHQNLMTKRKISIRFSFAIIFATNTCRNPLLCLLAIGKDCVYFLRFFLGWRCFISVLLVSVFFGRIRSMHLQDSEQRVFLQYIFCNHFRRCQIMWSLSRVTLQPCIQRHSVSDSCCFPAVFCFVQQKMGWTQETCEGSKHMFHVR